MWTGEQTGHRVIAVWMAIALGLLASCGRGDAQQPTAGVGHLLRNGQNGSQIFDDEQIASLARAACEGRVDAVNATRRVDPNARGVQGITPLLWALDCRNLPGVEALLRIGADPNQSTGGRGGYTPVLVAASVEDPAFLRLLLQHEGDPNASYEGVGTPALERAFQRGLESEQWENWRALLEAGANINTVYWGENGTIATFAANLNRFDKVVELLERGYSHDLTYLGFTVQPPLHEPQYPVPPLRRESEEARARAMAILAQRGVRFPVTHADVGLGNPNARQ